MSGGVNLYTYANANPINWVDPNGQFAWIPVFTLIGEIAGGLGAIDFLSARYYEYEIYKMLEDQKKFLEKLLQETDPQDCERRKFLEDAIKDIVLQQAQLGLLSGANLLGEVTTIVTGPDFIQPRMDFKK